MPFADVPGLAPHLEGVRDLGEKLGRNEGRVFALEGLAVPNHDADIEFVCEKSVRLRFRPVLAAASDNADFGEAIRHPRKAVPAAAELFEDGADDFRVFRVRDDVVGVVVVEVAGRPVARPCASEQFFADAARNVAFVVDNEIRSATTFNRDEEPGVRRPIFAGRGSDGCYNFALQHPTNAALVSRIAIEAVDVPNENAIGLAPLDAGEHGVEDRATGSLRRPALLQKFNDGEALTFRQLAQLARLRVEAQKLAFRFIGRFADVKKVSAHDARVSC